MSAAILMVMEARRPDHLTDGKLWVLQRQFNVLASNGHLHPSMMAVIGATKAGRPAARPTNRHDSGGYRRRNGHRPGLAFIYRDRPAGRDRSGADRPAVVRSWRRCVYRFNPLVCGRG